MTISSTAGQQMLGMLPSFLNGSSVFQAIFQAQGAEIDSLTAAITSILNQAYVVTADWDLSQWESELNLPANPGLTTAQDRSRILSFLRGIGTATTYVVENVAASYEGGQIQVIEDFQHYSVTILFNGVDGIPSNIVDLQNALRAVIPAHLGIIYQFQYLTWDKLDSFGWQWNNVDVLSDTWNQFEAISGNPGGATLLLPPSAIGQGKRTFPTVSIGATASPASGIGSGIHL